MGLKVKDHQKTQNSEEKEEEEENWKRKIVDRKRIEKESGKPRNRASRHESDGKTLILLYLWQQTLSAMRLRLNSEFFLTGLPFGRFWAYFVPQIVEKGSLWQPCFEFWFWPFSGIARRRLLKSNWIFVFLWQVEAREIGMPAKLETGNTRQFQYFPFFSPNATFWQ